MKYLQHSAIRRIWLVVAIVAIVGNGLLTRGLGADSDARIANLISQSGGALHVGALRSVRVVHEKGNLVSSGLSGSGDSWNEMGAMRVASLFSTAPLGGGSGWDGNASWSLDQTGLVIVDASVIGRSAAIDQAYFGNYDLWTAGYGGATVRWGGSKSDKGTDYDVLEVTPPKSSVPMDIWFDRATHLPVKMIETAGPAVTIVTLADFKPVHGLMLPHHITTSANGNDSSFTATSIEVNPSDGGARFAVPQSFPHDFSIADGATQASVPIDLVENHVYVDVMLNGRTFHFALDTGGANVIDPSVIKELGLASGGTTQVGGVGDATAASSFATISTLQIGNATLRNQVFLVLPIAQGFGVSVGKPLDGVIGYEVLSRFVTTFDYAANKLVFQMPNSYTAPPNATVIPIAHFGTTPQFACSIDGVPTTCTLDTGAGNALSFYTPFVASHPSVVPTKLTAPGLNGFGVGGGNIGRLGRVKTLAFGGLTLNNLVGDYTTRDGGALELPFLGANIGGEVLKRFTMTLDYRKLTMTLTPNSAFDQPDHWDRSGVFLINTGAVTITDVRPATPAARAGLVKGDAIVSVNGAAGLTLREVRDFFRSEPGTVEHVVVKSKGGATRDVTFTLEDYV